MKDLICVHILHSCASTLREVVINDNPQKAVQLFVACSIGCIQFLTSKDIVFNMCYYFMQERVMKAVKKSVNCKKTIQAFEVLIEKMKKFKEEKELEKLRQDNIKAGVTPEI